MLNKNILKSLDSIANNYQKLQTHLNDPKIISNIEKYSEIMKNAKSITPIYQKFCEYQKLEKTIAEAKTILNSEKDADLIAMAKEELEQATKQLPAVEKKLKILLLPKNELDDKSVIIEIRGAAGGEEANIFAADLYQMYVRYCESKKWKIELNELNFSESKGITFVSFYVKGKKAFARLKFETGSHRVQRIPETESRGRVHTSTAVVTIIPEADESAPLVIKPNELKIDTYRASGAGGQHVNTTDSAVRITHLPTNLVATSQDGRSQHANRDQAMRVLRSKIYEKQLQEKNVKEGNLRKLAGSGFRAEKIRTYNFPQNRVTDHRINYSTNNLTQILAGELETIVNALIAAEQNEKIEQISQGN